MIKVSKTTFEEEQKSKDEAFLKMSPQERMNRMMLVREKMKKEGVNYSYKGLIVSLKKSL
jgi:hypothetical protein